ncbi:MAG: aminopeptidase P N-terminal domain-containing protein [Bacteroidales bacterium]
MRNKAISSKLFIKNRRKILQKMPPHSMAVIHSQDLMPRNGDQFHPFRQDSDFFYATGIEQERSIVLFISDEVPEKQVQLCILSPNPDIEMWEGEKLSVSKAQEISGISEIHTVDDFARIFTIYAQRAKIIYLKRNENPRFSSYVKTCNDRFRKLIHKAYRHKEIRSFAPLLAECRIIKEPEEIELIREACDITRNAFLKVLAHTKPGMYEYEIEALLTSEFLSRAAHGHAFAPIVAQGKNACYLHYNTNTDMLEDGNLLFLDFGAEYANYASDCSRTFPINGTFSARQKEVYSAVLDVQKLTQDCMKPGVTIRTVHAQSCTFIEHKLLQLGLISQDEIDSQNPKKPAYFKYFMHGVSHFLGLDTHDVGEKDVELEPGMVLTCEPGIYIPEEGLGIRLENDILITQNGNENLCKDIPIEIDDLYACMNR